MTPSTTLQDSRAPQNAATQREYLAFRLGSDEYGIDILRVQEIRSYEPPTRIAHAPHFVRGVVNLRGTIVPIIDLRLKFGLEAATCDDFTVVIVLNVGRRVIGLVVDAVDDVIALDLAQHRDVPALDTGLRAEHLQAICTVDARLLLLLDVDRLLCNSELGLAEPGLQ
jgi:purine-binding chemotaxis protein CheW